MEGDGNLHTYKSKEITEHNGMREINFILFYIIYSTPLQEIK